MGCWGSGGGRGIGGGLIEDFSCGVISILGVACRRRNGGGVHGFVFVIVITGDFSFRT
jgi:hypothetical protein